MLAIGTRLDHSAYSQYVHAKDCERRHGLVHPFIGHDLQVGHGARTRGREEGVIVDRAVPDRSSRPKTDYTKALMAAAFELEELAAVSGA